MGHAVASKGLKVGPAAASPGLLGTYILSSTPALPSQELGFGVQLPGFSGAHQPVQRKVLHPQLCDPLNRSFPLSDLSVLVLEMKPFGPVLDLQESLAGEGGLRNIPLVGPPGGQEPDPHSQVPAVR